MSRIRNEDLVLKVSPNVDPNKWDEGRYDAFVDALCQGREYQKEAIFTALRFLAGGEYRDLRELARENFDENPKLKEVHGSWEVMESRLQLPDLLSCSLDLATGTGKSYVLYGIAAILLAEGAVDRVLTLCPSNTIEHGLTEKFKALAADPDLLEAMPDDAAYRSPQIINASESIVEGCICVENYHAILKHVKSAVRASLKGKGARTLVLNDEAHHVASANADRKKWKEFLIDEAFGFRRVVGVSGTCYVGNDYFVDVVSRYSLRQAVEERQVKEVEYIDGEPNLRDEDEKWQLIHKFHKKCARNIKKRISGRPLTIIVTKDITRCKTVAEDLRDFLRESENISAERADSKVLVVTSHKDHQRNIARLRTVDRPRSKVEWIISVSMLTEGWDVKNVFQIVPHEERAFNSKLLIAQVLGRGLRIPENWSGEQAKVTVFNHESWAPRIRHLVDEILDLEKRLSSVVLPDSEYHFMLHHLKYDKDETSTPAAAPDEYNLFERGYVELPTLPVEEDAKVEFVSVRGKHRGDSVTIRHKTFTADEVADAMHECLAAVDKETASNRNPKKRTRYAAKYPREKLLKVVLESIRRANIKRDAIPDEAKQKFLQALGAVRRKDSRKVSYRSVAKDLLVIPTKSRQKDSCSSAELQRDKSIFCRSDCEKYLPKEEREFFDAVKDEDGEYRGRANRVANNYQFKSPVNLAIADSIPESRFMRDLCDAKNAKAVDGWLKNAAMDFYAIEYAWSKPTSRTKGAPHIKRGMFSPDFFIKQGDRIIVVEIKDDGEIKKPSPENVKKSEYARSHFDRLNERLSEQAGGISIRYQFHMLTPKDYDAFFKHLREEDIENYRASRLDAVLKE